MRGRWRVALGAGGALLSLFTLWAGPASAAPRAPLTHEGRWITDAAGRVVTLHGWNMVSKVGSYRPEDAGFGPDDMRFLRRNGFNTVRLGIIYNGVEPKLPAEGRRARYREGYLRSISRTERQLSRHGIFTLLDAHQDMYNERFQGEGFPDWAVVGDAASLPAEPKQGFPANYLAMPALNRAFDHFWGNDRDAAGRPLQRSFAAMWRHVAKRFRDRRKVLGYNLLNEPWPGTEYATCLSPAGCPTFDAQYLRPFSERVVSAIRKADRRKLVWYAPVLTFDFGSDTSIGDLGDPNAGMAFNMYCLAEVVPGSPSSACDAGYELTLGNADQQSQKTGDALLMTEYGATDELAKIERVAELADEHMVGWQQWHYCDCDDPTTTGTGVQSIVPDATKPPRGANLNRAKLKASSRPYPQVVAGTPRGWHYDPDSKRFRLTYSTKTPGGNRLPRRLRSEVFIPPVNYHGRYRVRVKGASVASRRGSRLLVLERNRHARRVAVRVTPRGG